MPLTQKEKQELRRYEQLFGPLPTDAPTPLKPTARALPSAPQPPSRLGSAFRAMGEMTGLPAAARVGGSLIQGQPISKLDVLQTSLLPLGIGAGALKAGLGPALRMAGAGILGGGVGEYAAGPEAASLAERIKAGGPGSLRQLVAAGVEMAPSIAGGFAGAPAAGLAGRLARGGQPLTRPVSTGKEAAELLGLVRKRFAAPGLPKKVETTGEMLGALRAARGELGREVGEAKKAAYAAAVPPRALAPKVQRTIIEALTTGERPIPKTRFGSPIPALAPSLPEREAAKKVLKIASTAKAARTMPLARNIQSQLAEEAAMARKPGLPTFKAAGVYGRAEKAVDDLLKSFIPPREASSLAEANKKFSQFSALQELIKKSGFAKGDFNAPVFIKAWKDLLPEQRAKFTKGQLKALDTLVSGEKHGLLKSVFTEIVSKPFLSAVRPLFYTSGVEHLLTPSKTLPTRFMRPAPIAPRAAAGLAPVSTGALERGQREDKDLKRLRTLATRFGVE